MIKRNKFATTATSNDILSTLEDIYIYAKKYDENGNFQHNLEKIKDQTVVKTDDKFNKMTSKCLYLALDLLIKLSENESENIERCLDLSSKLMLYSEQTVLEYVKDKIDVLINEFTSGDWFKNKKSFTILILLNLINDGVETHMLFLLSEYILSSLIPRDENELLDLFRILSLFINDCTDKLCTGSLFFLFRILSHKSSKYSELKFDFNVSEETICIAEEYLEKMKSNKAFYNSYYLYINLLQDDDVFSNYKEKATNILSDQKLVIQNTRVFPDIIRLYDPQLNVKPKKMSEDQKLKKKVRKLRSEVTKKLKKEVNDALLKQFKEKERRRIEKEKSNRELLALLNAQHGYDLNIAAVSPEELKEMEGKNSEEEDRSSGNDEDDQKSADKNVLGDDFTYSSVSEEESD